MAIGKDRLTEFYEEVVNRGNIDRVDDFCTDDFVEHEPFPGIPPDREGVKQFFAQMRAAFPDLHISPVVMLEEGDRVIARFRMTGTHRGDFMGMPPTGRQVDIEGYDEVRIAGDRAAEHWGAMDGMVLMQQLGAVPEGAPAG